MSGGGGGSAGQVDYPDYMKDAHANILFGLDVDQPDEINTSVIAAFNDAESDNPYTGLTVYDPDSVISDMLSRLGNFDTLVNALDYATDFPAVLAIALAQNATDTSTLDTTTLDTATLDTITIDETRLDDDISAYDALLTAQLTDVELPVFKSGMLNIGAVNTSAYTIGEAILRAYKDREVSKYATGMRVELQKSIDGYTVDLMKQRREIEARHKLGYRQLEAQHKLRYRESEQAFKIDRQKRVYVAVSQMLGHLIREVELTGTAVQLRNDTQRANIISKKEEFNEQVDIDEREARWVLDGYQYVTGVLGGIAPAGPSAGPKRPSAALSALAGGLAGAGAGAATGAAIGTGLGGYGAAIGAVAGAALGYFSAQ